MYSENTPDDGQWNCPKHVEHPSKNKYEKLVHLVGFSIRKKSSTFWQILHQEKLPDSYNKCNRIPESYSNISLKKKNLLHY